MDKLDKLADFCSEPRSVFETFPILFRRPVGEREVMMASGEALAHLHWLEARNLVARARVGETDRFVAV